MTAEKMLGALLEKGRQVIANRIAPEDASREIRWLLAHEPAGVFEEAARAFSESVDRATNGQLRVKPTPLSEYFGSGAPDMDRLLSELRSCKLELCQLYTPPLGTYSSAFWALDLPFLFKDHDHATRVLDGAVGDEILSGLLKVGLRGLAFTYSGGFRIVATRDRELPRVADMKGLRLRTSPSPVAGAYLEVLGAVPHPASARDTAVLAESGEIDGAETTYPRYWQLGQHRALQVVNETYHSLFLTVIVVNDPFFQGMPEQWRQAVLRSAREAARMERAKSVSDGMQARQECLANGIRVVPLEPAEREKLAAAGAAVYERFTPTLGAKLLDRIRQS